MRILSVYSSFPSSVSLYVDGQIVAATHEERFTRSKNDEAFPAQSIKFCLDKAGIKADDLDGVAIASFLAHSFEDTVTRRSTWTSHDYLKEQHERWQPILSGETGKSPSLLEIFPDRVDLDYYPNGVLRKLLDDPSKQPLIHELRVNWFADFLGLSPDKVRRIEHHKCHAYYSYYASPFRSEKVLALTIDGSGDGLNATIGMFDESGNYERLYETSECNIARIYRYMTLYLGMKPNEHEFKVMGLAPYGKAEYSEKALNVFRETLYVDGVEFKWHTKPTDSYFWFKERLEGERFDNVAFALQTWVEELLVKWVTNSIEKFGINKIVVAGGVAMNIKAMGKIAELDCVDSLFIGGSASDESMAISAGICLAEDLHKENASHWNHSAVKPLRSLYLGPEASAEEEKEATKQVDADEYDISPKPTSKEIAKLLQRGLIMARCAGQMEFGQRALGNRSILADPKDPLVKEKINSAIKNRDFWMPFAPIVMDKFVDKYLANHKGIDSPHMTIGYNTTKEGYSAMIAACHPADKTARAQILTKDINQELYEIILEFSKLTERGALLNTSFNLHGFPIVNTPKEAIFVFQNSGLDGLILNNYLILKK